MLKKLWYFKLAVIWSIIITVLCLLPNSNFETTSTYLPVGFDKIVHVIFFFVLTILLFYGKIKQQESYQYRPFTVVKIIVITSIIGLSIEFMQRYIFIYRTGDLFDFIADMLGVTMGIFGYIFLHRAK
jgi:VanZ family protein